jgi:hypothetical protein
MTPRTKRPRESGLDWPGWFSGSGFGADWQDVPALERQMVRSTRALPVADEPVDEAVPLRARERDAVTLDDQTLDETARKAS